MIMNKDPQDSLVEIIKIAKNPNFHFEEIIEYVNMIKNYPNPNCNPFRCEWLEEIKLEELIINNKYPVDEIGFNEKVGNIISFNPIKVQKVI